MADRDPASMAEFFAAVDRTGESESPEDAEAPVLEPAAEAESEAPAATTPEDDEPEAQGEPDDNTSDPVLERIAQLEAALTQRDQQFATLFAGITQAAERERQQEIQQAQFRWQHGLATGELSQEDVAREQAQLFARHSAARMQALEAENQQLKAWREQQQEAEAKVEVIRLLATQFSLTEREVGYLNDLDTPEAMEKLARRFQADRTNQTAAARKAQAARRSADPVHKATGGVQSGAAPEEPTDMESYFASIRRPVIRRVS